MSSFIILMYKDITPSPPTKRAQPPLPLPLLIISLSCPTSTAWWARLVFRHQPFAFIWFCLFLGFASLWNRWLSSFQLSEICSFPHSECLPRAEVWEELLEWCVRNVLTFHEEFSQLCCGMWKLNGLVTLRTLWSPVRTPGPWFLATKLTSWLHLY